MAVWSVVNNSLVNHHSGRIDAEYYKTESLQAYDYVKKGNYKLLGQLTKEGYRVVYENTKILNPEKVDEQRDVRFLQATNVSDDGLWIEPKEIGFVSGKDWVKYPKGRIKHGELLIEVKGQAEKVTIVQDYMPMRTLVTGTLYKLTVDEKIVSPEYIFAYFSCKYGKILRDRTKVNTLISYVSKPELYNIPIPIFEESIDEITSIIRESYRLSALSHSLYHQAETLLVQELQLDKLKLPNKKWYTADYCEVVKNGRCDGDYYQPKYKQLVKLIDTYGGDSLEKVYRLNDQNYRPKELTEYKYIELADIGGNGNIKSCTIDIGKNLPSRARRMVHTGDIIISSIEGSLESCAIVTEEYNNAICSNGFYVLTPVFINSGTSIVLFKSFLLQLLMKKICSGTILTGMTPSEFKGIRIPIINSSVQENIHKLITNSQIYLQKSKQLLAQAKQRVEELIEQEANKYK